VDHIIIIILGEVHLPRVLKSNKDAPVSRPVQRTGVIGSRAILGGLHHHYARV
jgi:hypothetical protein